MIQKRNSPGSDFVYFCQIHFEHPIDKMRNHLNCYIGKMYKFLIKICDKYSRICSGTTSKYIILQFSILKSM